MAKRVPKNTPVAWVPDHPNGEGFYTVKSDDANDHGDAEFPERVNWVRNSKNTDDGHWEFENEGGDE